MGTPFRFFRNLSWGLQRLPSQGGGLLWPGPLSGPPLPVNAPPLRSSLRSSSLSSAGLLPRAWRPVQPAPPFPRPARNSPSPAGGRHPGGGLRPGSFTAEPHMQSAALEAERCAWPPCPSFQPRSGGGAGAADGVCAPEMRAPSTTRAQVCVCVCGGGSLRDSVCPSVKWEDEYPGPWGTKIRINIVNTANSCYIFMSAAERWREPSSCPWHSLRVLDPRFLLLLGVGDEQLISHLLSTRTRWVQTCRLVRAGPGPQSLSFHGGHTCSRAGGAPVSFSGLLPLRAWGATLGTGISSLGPR